MPIDRSTAAVLTAAVGVIISILFIGVTIYYDRKPSLRGRVSVVLVALLHALAFRLTYETCARWQYCEIDTNTFRVWSGVTTIHIVVAWVLCLRGLAIYIDDLLHTLRVTQTELVKALAEKRKAEDERDE